MARPRLGVLDLTMPGWTAGRTYTETVLRSLLAAGADRRFELVRLTTLGGEGDALNELPVAAHRYAPGRAPAGKGARGRGRLGERRGGSQVLRAGEASKLSVLLPLLEVPAPAPYGVVGWIPDFQHVHLPAYFSAEERAWRDRAFGELARNSTRVLLSSEAVRGHFEAFLPGQAAKASVAPFPSLLCFGALPPGPGSAVARYRLPRRFALVINQLWAHKNPGVVVEAAALARDGGVEVPVVMIGMPSDHRDPENKTVSRLLQRVAELGLAGQVTVLGKVSFADLVDLLRCAAVLIQPSRFEGWSTSVEDAKALGRPLLCSDLAVHREQAPGALGFFGCDDPGALARLLCEHFPGLPPGGDGEVEARALEAERAAAGVFGQKLLEVCGRARDEAGAR